MIMIICSYDDDHDNHGDDNEDEDVLPLADSSPSRHFSSSSINFMITIMLKTMMMGMKWNCYATGKFITSLPFLKCILSVTAITPVMLDRLKILCGIRTALKSETEKYHSTFC